MEKVHSSQLININIVSGETNGKKKIYQFAPRWPNQMDASTTNGSLPVWTGESECNMIPRYIELTKKGLSKSEKRLSSYFRGFGGGVMLRVGSTFPASNLSPKKWPARFHNLD